MAAIKVVQEITSLDGNATSDPIALKSGYLRVTPAGGDAFVSVGTGAIQLRQITKVCLLRLILQQFLRKEFLHQTTSVTNASGEALNLVSHLEWKLHLLLVILFQVTGCAPSGINTTSATVTQQYSGPDPTINGVQVRNCNSWVIGDANDICY